MLNYKIPSAASVAQEIKNGLADGTITIEENQEQKPELETNLLRGQMAWISFYLAFISMFFLSIWGIISPSTDKLTPMIFVISIPFLCILYITSSLMTSK